MPAIALITRSQALPAKVPVVTAAIMGVVRTQ